MLRKTADNCETGAVTDKTVFVKYCTDFKVFSLNHRRNIKIHFLSDVPHGLRFQYSKGIKNTFLELSYQAVN